MTLFHSRILPINVIAALAFSVIALAACSAPGGQPATSTASSSGANITDTPAPAPDVAGTPGAQSADPFPGEGPWLVEFETTDNISLKGTVFGNGPVTMVLAPMYPGEQAGWQTFAESAAEQGFRVLAFDFRGYGESDGDADWTKSPSDLQAAVSFLRQNGANKIILMGAGQGGLAVLKVAGMDEDIAGIAILSSPRRVDTFEITDVDLASITVPSLWLAARQDMLQDVEAMGEAVGSSDKEVWIYETVGVHGIYLFETNDGPDIERRLFEFATRISDS